MERYDIGKTNSKLLPSKKNLKKVKISPKTSPLTIIMLTINKKKKKRFTPILNQKKLIKQVSINFLI